MLSYLTSSTLIFLKDNYVKIIILLVVIAIFYSIYFLTAVSLKKLKTDIFSSYPFDLFFPAGGSWSIGYFILAIFALGLLAYFMLQGKFLVGPA